jgi:hypothetical protein
MLMLILICCERKNIIISLRVPEARKRSQRRRGPGSRGQLYFEALAVFPKRRKKKDK